MPVTKNTTVALTAIITATEDLTNNVVINRGTGNPAVDVSSALYMQQFQTAGPNIDTNLVLNGLNVDMFYIRNLDAAAIIVVKGTPQGGVAATIGNLQPGGQMIFFNPTTGKGWSALSVSSNVGSTGVEFFEGII